jgi:hypothetical protein
VEILTHHQPLLGAARNVLVRDNPRLDRLFDQIIGYDLMWTYVPGKANYFPDYLSRLPEDKIPPTPVDAVGQFELEVAGGPVYDAIAEASQSDPVVEFVIQCVHDGWPSSQTDFPGQFCFLIPDHHSLRISHGIFVDVNNRVYALLGACMAVLRELHMGHPGKVAMATRAKRLFSWQNPQADIAEYAESCGMCAVHRP